MPDASQKVRAENVARVIGSRSVVLKEEHNYFHLFSSQKTDQICQLYSQMRTTKQTF